LKPPPSTPTTHPSKVLLFLRFKKNAFQVFRRFLIRFVSILFHCLFSTVSRGPLFFSCRLWTPSLESIPTSSAVGKLMLVINDTLSSLTPLHSQRQPNTKKCLWPLRHFATCPIPERSSDLFSSSASAHFFFSPPPSACELNEDLSYERVGARLSKVQRSPIVAPFLFIPSLGQISPPLSAGI